MLWWHSRGNCECYAIYSGEWACHVNLDSHFWAHISANHWGGNLIVADINIFRTFAINFFSGRALSRDSGVKNSRDKRGRCFVLPLPGSSKKSVNMTDSLVCLQQYTTNSTKRAHYVKGEETHGGVKFTALIFFSRSFKLWNLWLLVFLRFWERHSAEIKNCE